MDTGRTVDASVAELGPCPVSLDVRVDGELVRINESATRIVVESVDAVGGIVPEDARSAAVRIWHLGLGAVCVSLSRAIVTLALHNNARAIEPLHRMLVEHIIRLKHFEAHAEEAERQWASRPIDFYSLIKDLGITGERADRIAADACDAEAVLPEKWRAKSIKEMVVDLEGSRRRGQMTYANIYRWPSQGAHATTVGVSTVFRRCPDGRHRLDVFGEMLDPNALLAATTSAVVMLAAQFDEHFGLGNGRAIAAHRKALDATEIRMGLRRQEPSGR